MVHNEQHSGLEARPSSGSFLHVFAAELRSHLDRIIAPLKPGNFEPSRRRHFKDVGVVVAGIALITALPDLASAQESRTGSITQPVAEVASVPEAKSQLYDWDKAWKLISDKAEEEKLSEAAIRSLEQKFLEAGRNVGFRETIVTELHGLIEADADNPDGTKAWAKRALGSFESDYYTVEDYIPVYSEKNKIDKDLANFSRVIEAGSVTEITALVESFIVVGGRYPAAPSKEFRSITSEGLNFGPNNRAPMQPLIDLINKAGMQAVPYVRHIIQDGTRYWYVETRDRANKPQGLITLRLTDRLPRPSPPDDLVTLEELATLIDPTYIALGAGEIVNRVNSPFMESLGSASALDKLLRLYYKGMAEYMPIGKDIPDVLRPRVRRRIGGRFKDSIDSAEEGRDYGTDYADEVAFLNFYNVRGNPVNELDEESKSQLLAYYSQRAGNRNDAVFSREHKIDMAVMEMLHNRSAVPFDGKIGRRYALHLGDRKRLADCQIWSSLVGMPAFFGDSWNAPNLSKEILYTTLELLANRQLDRSA